MQNQELSKQRAREEERGTDRLATKRSLNEQLQECEQRFRYTFDQAAVGMVHIGADGRPRLVNQRLCELLGYTQQELLHTTLKELTHPDDRAEDLAYYQEVIVAGRRIPYEREKRFRRKDGTYVWVTLTATPVYDSANHIIYYSGIVQDISERKSLEIQLLQTVEEAQERAGQMEAIIDAMTDHVSVYNREGRLMHLNVLSRDLVAKKASSAYVNQSLEERAALGVPRDEHGNPMSEDQWPLMHILRGKTIKGDQAIDIIYRLPNGEDIQVSISGAPIKNKNGEIVGAVLISRDVTERRRLERRTHEALDALVAMAKVLVETSPYTTGLDAPSATYLIGKRVVELTSRVLDCHRVGVLSVKERAISPVATVGFSEEEEHRWFTASEHRDYNLFDLLSEPVIRARLQANETLLLDLSRPPFDRLYAALGVHVILVAPIRVEDELVGVLYVDRGKAESSYAKDDITLIETMTRVWALINMRQRDAEELVKALATLQEKNVELEQLNKMQSNFIAMVGHEFRTTLTSIQGFSELLRDEQFDIEEVQEYASDIHTDALRLHRMINDLLDLERMKSGKMTIRLEQTDLNALLEEVVERTKMVAPHHTIRLYLDKSLPNLESDRDKLIQVVTNLLSNAIKYSPSGGEIVVRSFVEGGNAHVSVQDQGVGIPEDALERVFTPYSRIDSDKTRYVQGTGLGLPIVREIVELHGGRVWAESELGRGSTFHFVLPLMHAMRSTPARI